MLISKITHFGLKRQTENLKSELLDATYEAMKEGQFLEGPFTREFEAWLCKRTGSRYATLVHSGTQALEFIAKSVLEAQRNTNKLIILPNLTYPATLNAFLNTGWEIELVDTDKNGLLPDNTYGRDANRCYVGLYGAQAPRGPLAPLPFRGRGTIVDGAQHWLVADGHIGDAMAISFDPTKNLPSSGNGGAVVTNNSYIHDFIENYKNNGKGKNFLTTGTNSKMSEIDCAHLLVRTKYIDQWQERRKQIRLYYIEAFKDIPVRCLSDGFERHADQKFVIYTDQQKKLQHEMTNLGIETKIHYEQPLSELPVAKNLVKPDFVSVSSMLSRGVLSLPIYPELTDGEVEYIADRVNRFFDK
jgi:dTDP-4-amino-4,6-dideoxygalactose transaminase